MEHDLTQLAKVQPIRRVATKWQNCGKQDPLRIPHLFLSPDQGPKCFKFAGKLECKRQWLTFNQPQIWVLHQRFSLPVGTRSMDYLTTVLKPKFEEQNSEESFLQWEYGVAQSKLIGVVQGCQIHQKQK